MDDLKKEFYSKYVYGIRKLYLRVSGKKGIFIGDKVWKWFESKLKERDAQVVVALKRTYNLGQLREATWDRNGDFKIYDLEFEKDILPQYTNKEVA